MSVVSLLIIALILAIVLAIVFGAIILILLLSKRKGNSSEKKESIANEQNSKVTGRIQPEVVNKTSVLNEPEEVNKTLVLNEPENAVPSETNKTVMLFGNEEAVPPKPEYIIILTPKPGQDPAGYEYRARFNDVIKIGRGKGDILIEGDKSVSVEHCEITKEGSLFLLKDLNSSNGTFYNGSRVTALVPVESGGSLQIGRTEYVLTIGDNNWLPM